MKYLIALSILVSSSAFAQNGPVPGEKYKCWETAQEVGNKPSYVFREFFGIPTPPPMLFQTYPYQLPLTTRNGCVFSTGPVLDNAEVPWIRACLGEGQRVRGLIPVEIDEPQFEGTVYCEKGLKKWFFREGDETNSL